MNKIVRKHYPAEMLPADLQSEIGAGKKVTLTIEVEEEAEPTRNDWFSEFEHLRRDTFHSLEEVNEHISALRDEWSHRER